MAEMLSETLPTFTVLSDLCSARVVLTLLVHFLACTTPRPDSSVFVATISVHDVQCTSQDTIDAPNSPVSPYRQQSADATRWHGLYSCKSPRTAGAPFEITLRIVHSGDPVLRGVGTRTYVGRCEIIVHYMGNRGKAGIADTLEDVRTLSAFFQARAAEQAYCQP